MRKLHPARNFLLASLTAAVIAACSQPEAAPPAASQAGPAVDVATVVQQRITEWDEFTGRLQAPQTVALVPRVSGYLTQVLFQEGQLVQQGDLLFQIDDRAFVAEVKRLSAEFTAAKSQLQLAKNDLKRAEQLRKQNAIAEELLDARRARMEQSAAQLAAVSAALDKAQLDLSHSKVTAPISGRVSNALITSGNFVHAGQSQLTTIVSTDKIYAYFDADEQSYLKYVALAAKGERADSRAPIPVQMALASDNNYRFSGELDFLDNSINPQTGTIRARAVFDNKDNLLIPGLFANIKLMGSASYKGILIDDKAVGTDLNNKYVLVVDDKQQLQYRAVTLGEKIGGLRIIKQGLTANETIVVNGLQRVRPTMQITPNPVAMTSAETLQALKTTQHQLDETTAQLLAPTPALTAQQEKQPASAGAADHSKASQSSNSRG
ncbi:efflux RND transporter periplasmic adaptor subunit [Rheinheimera sp. 4Y26]|uniref:efflux RND transporter periplasmic adaptor subunit n=1 Tax=Rheinheimera sp. 4Y26 TaxID=2977811 RepID=UPI0021B0B588|nr:efflux RND transporter periplasmic adaptor subunit [Rheinheimera sp. 4Y26]MCT6698668.1 efflux RND transporter periplasmic adaptor subunit [Rheinheimera sp. 4Y26]